MFLLTIIVFQGLDSCPLDPHTVLAASKLICDSSISLLFFLSSFSFFNDWVIFCFYVFIIHSYSNGHSSYSISWLLWIVMQWTWGCIYVFELLFSLSSAKYSKSGIAGLYDSFSFLRNLHTVLHKCASIFISTSSLQGLPFFPHPHQNLLFLIFLIITRCKVISHCDFEGLDFQSLCKSDYGKYCFFSPGIYSSLW